MSETLRGRGTIPRDELQLLIRDLTGADPAARSAAGAGLLRHGTAALPLLLRSVAELIQVPGLRPPDRSIDEQRAESLLVLLSTINAIDAASGIRAMRMTLADQSGQVRQTVIRLLEASGHAGLLALEEALDAGSEAAQCEAVWELERLGSPAAVAALSHRLHSREPEVQAACAHALFNIALRNPVPELRLAAPRLEKLARFGATSPLPVRETCRQTLQQINAVTLPDPSLPIPASAGEPNAGDLPIPHQASESEGDRDA